MESATGKKTPGQVKEGDVVYQLCEKIREQAQQLTEAQKKCSHYETQLAENQLSAKVKDLERKLADMTRPIPLSDSLSFPPPSVSLSLSQLMELYSLLYVRMNELLKEKEELQTNLHEEILFSEEQSVILETMREEMVGSRTHRRCESAQTEAEELKETQEELRSKAEALTETYAEIAKLEEEKNALLEYVEQQAEREVSSQAEVARLQGEVNALREENQRLSLPQSPQLPSNSEEVRQLKDDLTTLRAAYEKTVMEMEELSDQNSAIQQVNSRSKELLAAQESDLKHCADSLEKSQKDLQLLKVKHTETLQLLEELKEFRQSEDEAQLAALHEAQSQKLEEDNKALRRMLSQLQGEIESLQSSSPLKSVPPPQPTIMGVDKSTLTDEDSSTKDAVRLCQSQMAALSTSFSALLSTLDKP